jgi:hypothetical protein
MRRGFPDSTPPFGSRNYLKSKVVMRKLGYKDRTSFWDFVYREGVPHTRFNARRIMFEEIALNDWLDKRSSG